MPVSYSTLIHVKEDRSLPDLSSAPAPLTDDDVVGFGRFRDTKLSKVPVWYIAWMVEQVTDYPRVARSERWIQVIEWLKSKKKA